MNLLFKVRNKDMSWPEEMSFIANSSKMDRHKGELGDNGGLGSNDEFITVLISNITCIRTSCLLLIISRPCSQAG